LITKALIIGFGSMGQKHSRYLSNLIGKENIFVLTSQKDIQFSRIESLNKIDALDPDYIIISSDTSSHFSYLKEIDLRLSKKIVLVEKPLFSTYENFYPSNNTYLVGYNLRFHPLIDLIKKEIKQEKVISFDISCNSFLPNWRKNIHYAKSSSASVDSGGGVLLDLSHELDYLKYIFGDVQHLFSKNLKLSNLEIDTDDYLIFIGQTKDKALFTINLSYFSKREVREITIETEKRTIFLDLIDCKMISFFADKDPEEVKKEFSISNTYIQQHQDILKGDFSKVCSYAEGLEVMSLIDKIQKFDSS